MISTLEENRKHYTQQQYERANTARELYQKVGHNLIKYYKKIIKMNAMNSFPVTIEDINIYDKIFGPDIYTLKGKKLRTKQKAVMNDYIEITQ